VAIPSYSGRGNRLPSAITMREACNPDRRNARKPVATGTRAKIAVAVFAALGVALVTGIVQGASRERAPRPVKSRLLQRPRFRACVVAPRKG
jgi:hypothetical protein